MHWRTRLTQPELNAPEGFRSLVTPVYRGSTVLFQKQADVFDDWRHMERGYSYGVFGTPTVLELGARIAALEGARHSFIVPGGQVAIALVYFAFCKAGSHALVPETAYGPNREMAQGLLKDLGVTVETYEPHIGSAIASLIRPETALIWCESPGSVTMEVQDVPAIVRAAHGRNVPVALDNTYSGGVHFDAVGHGIDVSMQALSKYVGGHSDILLGSVSVRDDEMYEKVGRVFGQLGMAVSSDECSLALRGLQTLAVRLEHLEKSTLDVAKWLSTQPAVDAILHPAFASCPGHIYWKRDFSGSSSVFSMRFRPAFSFEQIARFIDSLKLFKIGFSWGGVTSLAGAFPGLRKGDDGTIVRLNIGLEDTGDLIADLSQAMAAMA